MKLNINPTPSDLVRFSLFMGLVILCKFLNNFVLSTVTFVFIVIWSCLIFFVKRKKE